MKSKSQEARWYRVEIFLNLPQIWTCHYRGDLAMSEGIYEGLVRNRTGARLVRVADGKVLKEFKP